MPRKQLTASSSPQTQAASSGAPGSLGNSLREGNRVESGFQGSWLGSWTVDMLMKSGTKVEERIGDLDGREKDGKPEEKTGKRRGSLM